MSDYREHVWHAVANVIVPVLLLALVPLLGAFWVVDHNTKTALRASQVAACERGNALRSLTKIIALSQLADLKAASEHGLPDVRIAERANHDRLFAAINDQTNAQLLDQQPCR